MAHVSPGNSLLVDSRRAPPPPRAGAPPLFRSFDFHVSQSRALENAPSKQNGGRTKNTAAQTGLPPTRSWRTRPSSTGSLTEGCLHISQPERRRTCRSPMVPTRARSARVHHVPGTTKADSKHQEAGRRVRGYAAPARPTRPASPIPRAADAAGAPNRRNQRAGNTSRRIGKPRDYLGQHRPWQHRETERP